MSFRRMKLIALVALAFWISPALGSDSGAEDVLAEKGLRNVGSYWVLPGEKDLSNRLKSFGRLKAQLNKAVQKRDEFEQKIQDAKKKIRQLYAERIRQTRKLAAADSAWDHNQAVAKINDITDQINLLYQSIADAEHENPARTALAQAKDNYLNELQGMKSLGESTRAGYETLSADDDVSLALKELSDQKGKTVRLGPRKVFHRYLKDLEDLAAVIETNVVELERHGEVFSVTTTINGRHQTSMIFDTGASIVLIPRTLADRVGLQPTDQDPRIQLTIANGQTVEGILMTLDSLQIGNAKANNVECTVLPAELADVTPLLGGTFLRHFNYSISPDSGILTLTRIDTPQKKSPPSRRKRR